MDLSAAASNKDANLFQKYVRSSMKIAGSHIIKTSIGIKYNCIFCGIEMLCEGSLYAHMTTIRHLGLPTAEYQMNPIYECKICGTDLTKESVETHICVTKALNSYGIVVKYIDECGSPNMCILCHGLLFETSMHLNIHMLLSHGLKDFLFGESDASNDFDEPKRKPGITCPLCLAIFQTNDMTVLHFHAFDTHVADIAIARLTSLTDFTRAKYGPESEMKLWLSTRLFYCNFPYRIVKRFYMANCKDINRSLPEYDQNNCLKTFSSLINLTSHLCSYHLFNNVPTRSKRRSILLKKHSELENQVNSIQNELDLRQRSLRNRNVITDKIHASLYCLECFKIYRSNIDIQVHYMVSHSNFEWNICGICGYDCKCCLSICTETETNPERTNSLLWTALCVHEQRHISFFKAVISDPTMKITENLLLDFSDAVKSTLKPFEDPVKKSSEELVPNSFNQSSFTVEQFRFFKLLGKLNKDTQSEMFIQMNLDQKTR